MHKLFLCLRYLRKRRIAFFGMAAVGMCVALLIVATSLFVGFLDKFHYHIEQDQGQVILAPEIELADYPKLEQMLEAQPEIDRAMAMLTTGALLYMGRGDVRAVGVAGVSLEKLIRGPQFQQGLLQKRGQSPFYNPIISTKTQKKWVEKGPAPFFSEGDLEKVRAALERKLRRAVSDAEMPVPMIAGVGLMGEPDELTDLYDVHGILERIANQDEPMVITTGRYSKEAGETEAKAINMTCWCVDAVRTGWDMTDSRQVFVPFEAMLDLVGLETGDGRRAARATLQIFGSSGVPAKEIKAAAHRAWRIYAREVLNAPELLVSIAAPLDLPDPKRFTAEIRKQLFIIQVILGMIGLVASLLIFVILYMIVTQKKRDIGIVRSVGSTRSQLAGLFLYFGTAIGIGGGILGTAMGAYVTSNINSFENLLTKLFGFKIWKSGVYMFSEIPNEVAWSTVGWIVLTGIAFAAIGALAPALLAARLAPAESLRFE